MAVLGLSACGDDGGNGDSAQLPDSETTETPLTEEQLGKSQGTSGESELKLQNQEPAPELTEKERKQLEQAPKPKVDVNRISRQIYESSRFFCKEAGIEGLRREYSIESSDPKDIAREAARRTYGRGGGDAVYSGCLAGLTGK